MARSALMVCVVAALASAAAADRVILADGREFVGVANVQGDAVLVQMEYGTVRFPLSEVRDIEWKDTPEAELDKRLQSVSPDDANALADLAQWASSNELPRRAQKLYARVLELDPNHPAARAALDFVWLDGQWRSFEAGLELARAKLDAGLPHELLESVLPALERQAQTKDRQLAVRELAGLARLRAGQQEQAARLFEAMAPEATGPRALRLAAIASILKDNPDGMYVLDDPYPPGAELLGSAGPVLRPGPASLRQPLVLQAALHDRAKKQVEEARKLLHEAAKAADPDLVRAKYAQALQLFDRADALVPDISRSYRIEVVRRRIGELRRSADLDASEFDKENASLGKTNLSPQAYREKVLRLMYLLDRVRDGLKQVLDAAKPYPRELILEAKWAELDLQKIKEMRDVLSGELDARR